MTIMGGSMSANKNNLVFFIMFLVLTILYGCSSSPEAANPPDPLERTIHSGKVSGTVLDEGTWAWLGIPYARPPVGELRWKAPREPVPWSGVQQTDTFQDLCVQVGIIEKDESGEAAGDGGPQTEVVGDEDCLYLNLWRPPTVDKQLPVYVFIHGGGNGQGSSVVHSLAAANFTDSLNGILVSIDYRLGSLGWFAHEAVRTGDPLDDSGNFGTLDLVKALEWVKKNIGVFGGDPSNITIAGHSAGGINVYALLCSPLTKGLFQKAIVQSGPPISSPMHHAEKQTQQFLLQLLIQDGYAAGLSEASDFISKKNNAWTRSYLTGKTAEELLLLEQDTPLEPTRMVAQIKPKPLDSLITGLSALGNYEDGVVIPGNVLGCITSGDYHQVPMMLGCTTEEIKVFLGAFLFDYVKNRVDEEIEAGNEHLIQDMLKDPFIWTLLLTYEPLTRLGQVVFQDYGVDNTARLMSHHNHEVYVYKFAWDEEPGPIDFLMGATHGIDLFFLLGGPSAVKELAEAELFNELNGPGAEALAVAMTQYVTQFVRTGDPNGEKQELPEWVPWSSEPGGQKRIVFDTNGPYMSDKVQEPQELEKNTLTHLVKIFEELIKTIWETLSG